MPRVSVVIPAFNASAFLAEAVRSVQAQTTPPCEVLVVDDRSTDDTVAVAEGLGVTVLAGEVNRGPASARNLGIRAATGEWVAFLDADDRWHPRHLEILLSAVRDTAAVLAWTGVTSAGAYPVLPARPPRVVHEGTRLRIAIIADNIVAQTTAFARRDALLAAGLYREGERFAEDYELWLRMAEAGPFVEVRSVTCLYRRHAAQASRKLVELYEAAWRHRLSAYRRFAAQPAFGDDARRAELGDALCVALRRDMAVAWHDAHPGLRDALRRIADGTPDLRRTWQEATRELPRWPMARLRSVVRRLAGRR